VLQQVFQRLTRTFRSERAATKSASALDMPMIDQELSEAIVGSAQNKSNSVLPIIGNTFSTRNLAQDPPPMIGIQRGTRYAHQFAFEFVRWLKSSRHPLRQPVDAVLTLASRDFFATSGMPMPVTRNFLAALKKQQGVTTQPNVRLPNTVGSCRPKTTIYQFD
jgi:hypothetical protein